MTRYAATPRPDRTPWGEPLDACQVLPGLWRVSTADHGGLIVSPERLAAMPVPLQLTGGTYEEDVDWSLAVLACEAEFAAGANATADIEVRLAHDTARNWHPDRDAAFTGWPVTPPDNWIMRQRAAYQALIGEIVVVSASGDWADWVPKGKVGIVGRRLAGVDHLAHGRFDGAAVRALVAADRYESANAPQSFAALGAEPID